MDAIRWFSEYLTLVISPWNNSNAFWIFVLEIFFNKIFQFSCSLNNYICIPDTLTNFICILSWLMFLGFFGIDNVFLGRSEKHVVLEFDIRILIKLPKNRAVVTAFSVTRDLAVDLN